MPNSVTFFARTSLLCLSGLALFSMTGCGTAGSPAVENSVERQAEAGSTTASIPQPEPVPEEMRVPEELSKIPAMILAGKTDDALKLLEDWIAKHPQDPRGYTLRAGVYSQTGNRDATISDLNKFVELSPNDADALHSRGLFYMMQGPTELARADFEAAIKIDPSHDEAANHLGLLKLSNGEFLASIGNFDTAIKANPTNYSYFNNRGLAYWRAGNLELARADFDAAVKVSPQNANARSNRGQLAFQQKKYEEAISDFTTAIASDPYNLNHYKYRQAAYLKLGRLMDAENNGRRIVWLRNLFHLQEAVQKQPENLRLQVRLGEHFAEEKDNEMALKVFNSILQNFPNETAARLGRAQVMMQNQEYQKVVEDCSTILQTESLYEAFSLRGDAWFQLGKYNEAIADFEASQRFDRQVSDAYYLRSQQRAAAGDQPGADADLLKSKQIAPKMQTADAVE